MATKTLVGELDAKIHLMCARGDEPGHWESVFDLSNRKGVLGFHPRPLLNFLDFMILATRSVKGT